MYDIQLSNHPRLLHPTAGCAVLLDEGISASSNAREQLRKSLDELVRILTKIYRYARGVRAHSEKRNNIRLILHAVGVKFQKNQGLHRDHRNLIISRDAEKSSEILVALGKWHQIDNPYPYEVTKFLTVDEQR